MAIYEEVQGKLEGHTQFRERRFRGKYLAILALRNLGIEQKYNNGVQLTLEELDSFAKKYDSYRHEMDCVQRDCPELRGKDYDDKKKVVQEKLVEFGYSTGHYQDVKKLNTIN